MDGLSRMPAWMTWVAVVAVLYMLLAWGASRTLYFPMKYPAGDWRAKERIGAEDVWIREGLHGWFAKRPHHRWVTLHLHGNAGNITHRIISAAHILEAGSSVLLLDYRGYGRSEGRPSERGFYEDAVVAYDWLVARGYRPDQIILHGESIGTPVATHVAVNRRCAGLVLEAPFTSARAVAGKVLPVLGPTLVWGYDTLRMIDRLNVPLLIIHGDADEVIAYEFGQELFEAAPQPKTFWTVRGATHNDLHLAGAPEFRSRLESFYASLPQRVINDPE